MATVEGEMNLQWTGERSAGCFNDRSGWMVVRVTPEQRQAMIEEHKGKQLCLTIGDTRIPVTLDEAMPDGVIRFRRVPGVL